ncbi:MAG TPA: DUF1385 domain-containing protein [Bryobacteraceae bacterium]|nr:DUF1385 domain-containing protein [Bryobacteraceae bacterium]
MKRIRGFDLSLRSFLRLFAHVQMLPILESGEETLVGGQAVMEGVMMRAPHSYCVAVRKPTGEIVSEELPIARMSEKHKFFKWPVLRGMGVLGQAMTLGMKALSFSANAALDDGSAKTEKKEMPKWVMGSQILFSVLFFIVLYKLVPLKLTEYLSNWAPVLKGQILFNTVDGVIRIVLFVGFLLLLCRSKDIRRTFEYHGAEHKVVFNFESGKPVTVENSQQFVTFHPRCGTSFMFVIMLMSMLCYIAVPIQGFAAKLAFRIVMLPVLVGLSYELIRFAAKRRGSFMAMLTAPGLWIQRITTQPPSNEQAEVAIHALNGAMALETKQGGDLVIA